MVELPSYTQNKIINTLRQKQGDKIKVFDGQNEFVARITELKSRKIIVLVEHEQITKTESILDMHLFQCILKNDNMDLVIQKVTLAIGAGIYEEFLFRVLLIASLTGILKFIFLWKEVTTNVMAVILSGGIFSAFHFMGEYGDFFSMELFLLRFFAGIILGGLYYFRGFGITAYTHSIYDLILEVSGIALVQVLFNA